MNSFENETPLQGTFQSIYLLAQIREIDKGGI